MKAALSVFARRWWAGKAGMRGYLLSGLLAPASWAYGLLVSMRNGAYERDVGERVPGLRVISVGNLAVGGTGKTPLSAWVARFLSDRGVATAIVSRGYGRDELVLHRQWNPEVAVEADSDRILAAVRARDAGAAVAVLDDGFQHRRLARDLDLVILAAEDRFPGRLLPTGPYREPAASLARADVILVTRRTALLGTSARDPAPSAWLRADASGGRRATRARRVAGPARRAGRCPLGRCYRRGRGGPSRRLPRECRGALGEGGRAVGVSRSSRVFRRGRQKNRDRGGCAGGCDDRKGRAEVGAARERPSRGQSPDAAHCLGVWP